MEEKSTETVERERLMDRSIFFLFKDAFFQVER